MIKVEVAIIPLVVLFLIVGYQMIVINKFQYKIKRLLFVLGYYRMRFGEVSKEDIKNKIGISKTVLRKYFKKS